MKNPTVLLLFLLPAFLPSISFAGTGVEWNEVTSEADWPARWKHTSVSYDGKLWVMGGNRSWQDVWFSENGADWTLATANPGWEGRQDHASVVFENKLWVLGGWFDRSTTFGRFNDVWSSTDAVNWTPATLDAPWEERDGHSVVEHNGKMWLMGGYRGIFFNDVWWSTDGENWTAATLEAEWPARGDMTAVSYDGKLWIMGGNGGEPGRDYLLPHADVWCSEDGANWIQVTDDPPWGDTRYHTSVVYDDRIWLLGGGYPHFFGPVHEMTNEVWWTTDGVAWTLATDSADWIPRGEHTSVVHDGKMWVLGGRNQEEGRLNDVWSSSPRVGLRSDINLDGVVNDMDLTLLMSDWGKVSDP